MGPEWVAFTRIVLLDTPHLDGAKCRGHWQLFDRHTHNDPNREIDEAIAVQMCATCPALLPCKQWLASLPPYLRPAGWSPASCNRCRKARYRQVAGPEGATVRPQPKSVVTQSNWQI